MRREKIAFVLAGGGSKGAYECGALIALNKMGIKADMVCGSSSGSLVGALYCQNDLKVAVDMFSELETDEVFEIERDATLWDYAKAFIFRNGADPKGLKDGIKKYISENKIRESEVDFGLVTVEIPWFKGHYLWKNDIPKGKMQDYILASASAFPMIKYHEIDGKKFIDGAYVDVMPVNMALKHGATKVYAIDLLRNGIERKFDRKNKREILTISSKWELGFPLDFDSERQRSMLRMGFLDTYKALGKYEGEYYCFEKNAFKDKDTLFAADCCGRFFNLNPAVAYNKTSFMHRLKASIKDFENSDEYDEHEALDTLSAVFSSQSIDNVGEDGGYGSIVLALAAKMMREGGESVLNSGILSTIFDETLAAARFIVDYNLYKLHNRRGFFPRVSAFFYKKALNNLKPPAVLDYITGRYFVHKAKTLFHKIREVEDKERGKK